MTWTAHIMSPVPLSQPVILYRQTLYRQNWETVVSVSAGHIIQTDLGDRGLCLSRSHYTDRLRRPLPLSQPVNYTDRVGKPWPLSQPVILYRQSWETVASVSAGHIIQTELEDRGLCLSQSYYTDRVGRPWSLYWPVILYRQT